MKNRKGFTLIELIATLVLLGILAAVAGIGSIFLAEGYVFTKTNTETVQKAQLAVLRLTKEFTTLSEITPPLSPGANTEITFELYKGSPTPETHTVRVENGALVLVDGGTSHPILGGAGDPITVSEFTVTEDTSNGASELEFVIKVIGAAGTEIQFTNRVTPRNLALLEG